MSAKWMIGFIMAFIALSIYSGIVEQSYLGTAEGSRLQILLQPFIGIEYNWFTAPFAFFNAGIDWIRNLWGMFWWDYAMFQGVWTTIRLFFLAISIGMIVTIILTLIGSRTSG